MRDKELGLRNSRKTQLADSIEPFPSSRQNGEATERLDGAVAYGGQVQGDLPSWRFDNLEWTRGT